MISLQNIFYNYQKTFFSNQKKRKVWIASRQIGKSFCSAGILVSTALKYKDGLSVCISVNSRSASEILKKCCQFAEAIKIITNGKITYEAAYDHILFSTGARVISLPSTSDGLRGWTIKGSLLIDEFCFIRNLDDILQGIGPALTRSPDAQLVLCSTPGGKNSFGYELYSQALNNADWYVQTTTIHQAIDDGLKIDLNSLHSLCPDENVFRQEYECVFQDSYGGMLDTNNLVFYEEKEFKDTKIYLGVDVGRSHDNTSIIIARVEKDVIYIEDVIVLHNVEYQKQLDVIKSINDKYNIIGGFIDGGGIGHPISEFVQKTITRKIQPFNFNHSSKNRIYEQLIDRILRNKILFNSKFKTDIINDFKNVEKIIGNDGQVKYIAQRNQAGHSDIVSSLALVLESIRVNPENTTIPLPYRLPTRL